MWFDNRNISLVNNSDNSEKSASSSNEQYFGMFVKLNEKEQNKSLLAQNYVVVHFTLNKNILS